MEETVESVEKLKVAAIYNLNKGKDIYVGLMGTSGLGEIDQDTRRMIKEDSTLEKDSHLAIYVDGNDGQSAHDVARDAERVLIRNIGLNRLLNDKHPASLYHVPLQGVHNQVGYIPYQLCTLTLNTNQLQLAYEPYSSLQYLTPRYETLAVSDDSRHVLKVNN